MKNNLKMMTQRKSLNSLSFSFYRTWLIKRTLKKMHPHWILGLMVGQVQNFFNNNLEIFSTIFYLFWTIFKPHSENVKFSLLFMTFSLNRLDFIMKKQEREKKDTEYKKMKTTLIVVNLYMIFRLNYQISSTMEYIKSN